MVATTATITPTKTCMTSKAEADSNTEAGNIGGIMDIIDRDMELVDIQSANPDEDFCLGSEIVAFFDSVFFHFLGFLKLTEDLKIGKRIITSV